MTPLLISRLKSNVAGLSNRTYGAASLAALMRADAIPNVTPCAHVIPAGIHAPKLPSSMSGVYLQGIERSWAVFLSLRVHDPNGEKALDEAAELIDAIIFAIAGWEPTSDSIGVFIFRHAVLRTFERGVAIYEISFSLSDQLRINT